MANPPVRARAVLSARGRRRRIGLWTDVAVLGVVVLFVLGAFLVGLIELHAGLAGR